MLTIMNLLWMNYEWIMNELWIMNESFMNLQMSKIGCVNYACFPKSGHIWYYVMLTMLLQLIMLFMMSLTLICSNRTDEHLPNLMWCREPFMEALNEIEDIN